MLLNEEDKEFLSKLAKLVKEYNAEFYYTNDDDGIHIDRVVNGVSKEIFVGFNLQKELNHEN